MSNGIDVSVDVVDGLNSMVYDENNQEKRSWKFCNFKLPRSEVVFFCQIIIVVFIVVFSCVNLCLSQKCEENNLGSHFV